MTAINPGGMALRARIGLLRLGVTPVVIAISLMFGAATWLRLAIDARAMEAQEHTLTQARQGLNVPLPAPVVSQGTLDEQHLRQFYEALGDRAKVEQHLKNLFEIAEQTGISLDEGEYQWQQDKNSNIYRYQILLPVKGSYGSIRQFCAQTLLALPFASLDEWSFKRDSIGDDAVDVSLRFTLYLKDGQHILQPSGTVK